MILTVILSQEGWEEHSALFETSMNGEALPGMTFQGYTSGVEDLVVRARSMELREEGGERTLEIRVRDSKALLFYGVFIKKVRFEDIGVFIHFHFETWHKIMGSG